MSMTLPQSVLSQISIFWKGDCTSSSLRVTRRPKAEPVCSKFSCSQVGLLIAGVPVRGGPHCSLGPRPAPPRGYNAAPLATRKHAHARLVARPSPPYLLHSLLERGLLRRGRHRPHG